MISEETRAFIDAHLADDLRRLALSAKVPEGADLRAVLTQIEAVQLLKRKAPRLAMLKGAEFPGRAALEQCSGEAAAAYKAGIVRRAVPERGTMADLAGGLGVDFMAMSPLFAEAAYVDRDGELCDLARNNFKAAGMRKFSVVCADSEKLLQEMKPADFVFIDPARRIPGRRRAVLPGDCAPDVTKMLPFLERKCRFLMLKLSPMLDISAALRGTSGCRELHVVAVNGEVKEIISLSDFSGGSEALIVCSEISAAGTRSFSFRQREEREASCGFCDEIGAFLYEPAPAVLKAGAFRLTAQRYGLRKLHPNTHLYTSDEFNGSFMGKVFKVEGAAGFPGREARLLCKALPGADVAVRNFPVKAEELRRRLRVKAGGGSCIFGTTLRSGRRVLAVCRLLSRGGCGV